MKGHMTQNRQELRSTHSNREAVWDARRDIQDMSLTRHICTATEDKIYCFVVIGDKNKDTIYNNLTG